MKIFEALKLSLMLLSQSDRRRLILVTLLQMSTALLDLAGVLMIGLVTALAVASVSNVSPPAAVERGLSLLGISTSDPAAIVLWFAVAAGMLLMSKSLLNIVLTRRILRFLANRQALVSGRLAEGLLTKPLLQVQQRSSQETSYALTAGANFATLVILGQGVVIVSEASLLLILAVGLLAVSPVVTLFTILFFVVVASVLQRLFSTWAGKLGVLVTDTEVASIEVVQEAIRSYRESVVSNRRTHYIERFRVLRWQTARAQSDLQFMSLVPKYVFEFALVIGAALLAASQLFSTNLSGAIATIVVFLAAGSRVIPSLLRLQGALITIRAGAGQAKPTYELAMELGQLGPGARQQHSPPPSVSVSTVRERLRERRDDLDASVDLMGVSFRYPGLTDTSLKEISLSVPAGTSLALVGPTGAGKSTLVDVMLGILEPDEGQVLIGGLEPLAAMTNWPGAMAYVPQDVSMANGSVRSNVALGLPDEAIDDDLVWQALDRAYLAQFLRDSRNGLDTQIGEHGLRLSGGQRQRLGLARALYSSPRLLVLDEATSALDSETEHFITKTLSALEGEVTRIIVAHRLATVTHSDAVAYLDEGRLVALGTFQQVREVVPALDQQARLLNL